MTDEKLHTYPDIPLNQWWKLRALFRGRLVDNISIKYLEDALAVKPPSAKGIYRNLQLFGFIDKDGKTTERANQWRVDDHYSQVCKDIMSEIYPQGLLDAPIEALDRNHLIDWFVRNTRVGEKYAAKNAAVFELLREADFTKAKDGKAIGASQVKASPRKQKPPKEAPVRIPAAEQPQAEVPNGNGQQSIEVKPEKPVIPDQLTNPSVHINIQIHIAPDAPSAQIEDIFAAIERHLYKQRRGE